MTLIWQMLVNSSGGTTFVLSLCGFALVFLVWGQKLDENRFLFTLGELLMAYLLLLGAEISFSTRQDAGILLGPLLTSFPLVYIWKYGRRQ